MELAITKIQSHTWASHETTANHWLHEAINVILVRGFRTVQYDLKCEELVLSHLDGVLNVYQFYTNFYVTGICENDHQLRAEPESERSFVSFAHFNDPVQYFCEEISNNKDMT